MSSLKFSSIFALASVAIVFIIFNVNFWVSPGLIPGYKIVAYPGIIVTRLFSEEINLWPKLGIMLSGQFILCFAGAYTITKIVNWYK